MITLVEQFGGKIILEKGEITVIIGGSGCGKRVIVTDKISLLKTDKG